MPLTVRAAVAGDLEALVANALGVARESEGLELDAGVVRRGTQALLADPARGRALVAQSAGQVVGSLYVTFEWSDWHAAWYWWIQSAYVRPEARGQGVFRALYEATCQAARQEGARSVRLYVEHNNERGLATYRRLGMQQTSYLVYEQVLHQTPDPQTPRTTAGPRAPR